MVSTVNICCVLLARHLTQAEGTITVLQSAKCGFVPIQEWFIFLTNLGGSQAFFGQLVDLFLYIIRSKFQPLEKIRKKSKTDKQPLNKEAQASYMKTFNKWYKEMLCNA